MKSTMVYGMLCAIVVSGAVSIKADSNIDVVHRHAYSANTGWIDCRADATNGVVVGQFYCSGYAYGGNIGWIDFGDGTPGNGYEYGNASAADFGVNHDGAGLLRGYAYSPNVGWIAFETNGNPRIDLLTGKMSGYAYAANAGWISLSNTSAHVEATSFEAGPDTDGDGIPDAWEYAKAGDLATYGPGDDDLDGVSDLGEYVSDTDPGDMNSLLQITRHDVDEGPSTNSLVTWASVPTRLYRLERMTVLSNNATWVDSGLGVVAPDAGTNTSRTVIGAPGPSRFYRVRAVLPPAN